MYKKPFWNETESVNSKWIWNQACESLYTWENVPHTCRTKNAFCPKNKCYVTSLLVWGRGWKFFCPTLPLQCVYLGWTRWLADLEFLRNKLPDLATLTISSSSDISGSSTSLTSVKWGCSNSSECSGFSKLRFKILTSVPFWRFTSRFDFYYSKDQIFGLSIYNFVYKSFSK